MKITIRPRCFMHIYIFMVATKETEHRLNRNLFYLSKTVTNIIL